MEHVCDECTNYKRDSQVSADMSVEDCFKFCSETSACLGVSVARFGHPAEGDCWQILELPDEGWDKQNSNSRYNTWKKGSNT